MTQRTSKASVKVRPHDRREVMPHANVTGSMLAQMASHAGREFSIAAPSLGAGDVAVHGRLNNYACHSGLRVHATDTVEAHDLKTEVVTGPKVSVAVFLEGFVDLEIDGKRTRLGRGAQPSGQIWVMSERSAYRRLSRKGTHVRKVIISVPPEWIGAIFAEATPETPELTAFLTTHGAMRRWTPSKRALALAEQILSPTQESPAIRNMSIESKAIEIVTEALSDLTNVSACSEAISVRALSRAQKIRAHLLAHIDQQLSLGKLAKDLGISIESMQRAFKAAYGSTIVDFVREYRLHQARKAMDQDGISVSEAAYLAGYTNPANFSTAFKKLFGLTPSQSRQ